MHEESVSKTKPDVSPGPNFVSVVVPVFNGGEAFDRCLAAIDRSDWPAFECIVVDDASSDPQTADIARGHPVQLQRMEQRGGPALARNAGAMNARGDIIFFTDADVMLHSDTLGKAVTFLQSNPDFAAVFGSYDDEPEHGSLLSRYRNLYHHWNHQIGNEEASTFWTGCGAIRRDVFLEMGGFSSSYTKPSIEDIELGYRLREAGYRIRLLKTMLGTHLKHWKFWDMVRTDIFRRGMPWIALLWQFRSAPPDLNLNARAKTATVCAALLPITLALLLITNHSAATIPTLALLLVALVCNGLVTKSCPKSSADPWKSRLALLMVIVLPLLTFAWARDPWALLPLLLIGAVVWAQADFYRLLHEKGGSGFAVAAVPFQIVFFMGCALSVPLGFLAYLRSGQAGMKR